MTAFPTNIFKHGKFRIDQGTGISQNQTMQLDKNGTHGCIYSWHYLQDFLIIFKSMACQYLGPLTQPFLTIIQKQCCLTLGSPLLFIILLLIIQVLFNPTTQINTIAVYTASWQVFLIFQFIPHSLNTFPCLLTLFSMIPP